MATKIRLKRIGRRNRPFYRVIIIDSRKRRDGSAIEQVGWYNPIEKDKEKNYSLKEDRILEWLKLGAQVSDPVNKLMKRSVGKKRIITMLISAASVILVFTSQVSTPTTTHRLLSSPVTFPTVVSRLTNA